MVAEADRRISPKEQDLPSYVPYEPSTSPVDTFRKLRQLSWMGEPSDRKIFEIIADVYGTLKSQRARLRGSYGSIDWEEHTVERFGSIQKGIKNITYFRVPEGEHDAIRERVWMKNGTDTITVIMNVDKQGDISFGDESIKDSPQGLTKEEKGDLLSELFRAAEEFTLDDSTQDNP